MLTRARILELIPHQGTMCLLDEVTAWSDATITCRTRSHLSPDNPLRRMRRPQCPMRHRVRSAGGRSAWRAARRSRRSLPATSPPCARSRFLVERLDDPSIGALEVTARLELRDIERPDLWLPAPIERAERICSPGGPPSCCRRRPRTWHEARPGNRRRRHAGRCDLPPPRRRRDACDRACAQPDREAADAVVAAIDAARRFGGDLDLRPHQCRRHRGRAAASIGGRRPAGSGTQRWHPRRRAAGGHVGTAVAPRHRCVAARLLTPSRGRCCCR